MNKRIIIIGLVLGLLSVILGAFAAHGLKPHLDIDQLKSFETGVRYQMYHALFLIFLGVFNKITEKTKKLILILVVTGVILFSGSIYGLATNHLSAFNFKQIALITPIGGLFLITSWLLLIIKINKIPRF